MAWRRTAVRPVIPAWVVEAWVVEAWTYADPAGVAWLDALRDQDPEWWYEALVEFLSTPAYAPEVRDGVA